MSSACRHVVIRSPFDPPRPGGAADHGAANDEAPPDRANVPTNIMVNPRIRRRSRLGRAAGGPSAGSGEGGDVPGLPPGGPGRVVSFDGPIVVVEEEVGGRGRGSDGGTPADTPDDGGGRGKGSGRRRTATSPPVEGRCHASVQTDDEPVRR